MRFKLLYALLMFTVIFTAGCGGGGGGVSTSITQYTTITGTIIDSSTKQPISGVSVSIGNVTTTTTNNGGLFTTSRFVPGTYDITFSKAGYATKSYSNIVFNAGNYAFDNPIPLQTGAGGESPTIIKDVPVISGTGQITIAANGHVDTLIAIPYNTATSDGSYETTVTINADSQNLSTVPITSKVSAIMQSNSDLKESIREQERELMRILQSKNQSLNMRNNLAISNPARTFKDDLSTLTFNKLYNDSWTPVTATKKYTGSRCLIYVDEDASGSHLSQTYIEQLGQTFDSFYEREIQYFGLPTGTLGDVDDNDMIYILLTELEHTSTQWVAGYFHGVHEVPTSDYAKSNQKEMLFITTHKPDRYKDDAVWLSEIKGTLAHEFQHLIFFNHRFEKYNNSVDKYNSEVWINEGLSMVAEDLAINGPGYNHNTDLDDRVIAYLKNSSSDSLCTWKNIVADYAPAYMFMRYFVDRYTEERIREIIASNSLGTAMLTSITNGVTFSQLFRDWLAAVILDRLNYSSDDATFNNNYLYKTLNLSSYSNLTLGQLSSGSSIVIPDTTGGFIIKTGLSGCRQISVSIRGNSVFGLRLVMIPSSGITFSQMDMPKLIRVN